MAAPALCRDCLTDPGAGARCPACRSPRLLRHPELFALSVAHVDCDAFYAAIEKRDDPSLADRPLIVGGGRRGVVATCCYIARTYGVRSAMPMFKALAACPDAVVIRPRMAVYAEASRRIRALFEALTPLVEPLSLDEAFLDLTGADRVHGGPAAPTLARLQARIEAEVGVTVSVGLSHNKFLAKMASEREKPRGFSVIGRAETDAFLAPLPVTAIWGVGAAMAKALRAAGYHRIGDLRAAERTALIARFGALGARLHDLSHGRDARLVTPERAAKSLSAETTFEADTADRRALEADLWRLCVRVTDRLKAKGLTGATVVLKLRRADFRLLTRRTALADPTQLADRVFAAAAPLLAGAMAAAPFRLIGVGVAGLRAAETAGGGLFDRDDPAAHAERAVDAIRARFGDGAIGKGRAL